MTVFTIQKRTYARLQTRICWGFQRPTSSHFTRIGVVHIPTSAAAPITSERPYVSSSVDPAAIHMKPWNASTDAPPA